MVEIENTRVSTKSDIWGLGGVLWDLMHSDLGMRNLKVMRQDYHEDVEIGIWPGSVANPDSVPDISLFEQTSIARIDGQQYTTWLHQLVHSCTHFDSEQRPDALEIINSLRETDNNFQQLLGQNYMDTIMNTESNRLRYSDYFPMRRKLNITRRRRPRP